MRREVLVHRDHYLASEMLRESKETRTHNPWLVCAKQRSLPCLAWYPSIHKVSRIHKADRYMVSRIHKADRVSPHRKSTSPCFCWRSCILECVTPLCQSFSLLSRHLPLLVWAHLFSEASPFPSGKITHSHLRTPEAVSIVALKTAGFHPPQRLRASHTRIIADSFKISIT